MAGYLAACRVRGFRELLARGSKHTARRGSSDGFGACKRARCVKSPKLANGELTRERGSSVAPLDTAAPFRASRLLLSHFTELERPGQVPGDAICTGRETRLTRKLPLVRSPAARRRLCVDNGDPGRRSSSRATISSNALPNCPHFRGRGGIQIASGRLCGREHHILSVLDSTSVFRNEGDPQRLQVPNSRAIVEPDAADAPLLSPAGTASSTAVRSAVSALSASSPPASSAIRAVRARVGTLRLPL